MEFRNLLSIVLLVKVVLVFDDFILFNTKFLCLLSVSPHEIIDCLVDLGISWAFPLLGCCLFLSTHNV